ncbi:MAG TPA: AI-2E family transporter [Sulfurovum sp.]|nr:MAG: AI-2E family transporter [Sulfurovum sp. 35-42-20]OYZ26144.1 MAG: AI-2E family transporter [Sulfurovum sp. 16-42-52]OZA46182.1 MAG: AI-2E family transporter [Sulfurovum sp. 17-42-90]OZA60904.1 MAG: AI-2E family transporter [Sulfurovum sp. 39-42-12]HQR74479.1 AI-2E family transporter [Sulfurovum sp.]
MRENYFLRWVGFVVFVLVIWLFFPFLKSFFVALLMAMATFSIYHPLETKLKQSKKLKTLAPLFAAGMVTLLFSLIVFIPITLLLYYFFSHPSDSIAMIHTFLNEVETLSENLPNYLDWLKTPIDTINSLLETRKEDIVTFIAGWLGNGLKNFMQMLGNMIMVIVFFFFLTLYGRKLLLFFVPIIPLARSVKRDFLREMTIMVSVVFYTLMGVMITQGLAFGIFIAFFDGYNPVLLGFLVGIVSVIPIIGTALVWVPLAVNEYLHGNVIHALIISLYSYAMMAVFIDNIIKLVILNFINRKVGKNRHRINDFIIFFAVVGGLATFGFWGFILGPAIVALAATTLITLRKANRSSLAHEGDTLR